MTNRTIARPIGRLGRLGLFGIGVLLAAYLLGNFGLAWIYANALTRPACWDSAAPIQGFPTPQDVALTSEDGITLRAWYYPPKNGTVILAFGGPCGALGEAVPPVSFLLEQGYGILQFDSRAHAMPKTPVTLGGDEIHDVKAGLDFLLAQPQVERIGAYGFSMGGVTVIRAAARNPEIAAVVAEGGYYNLGLDFIEPEQRRTPIERFLQYNIAWAFWAASGINPWQLSPVDDLPLISPRPVFLIYGEHELASGRGRIQYDAAKEPKELWIVPGGSHGGNHLTAPQEYQERVSDFFAENLLAP